MSLYSTLFDENNETPVLLGMIGLNKEFFSRFRDIDLINKGTVIRVFTRLGGGNREEYEETWNKIRKNELYIKDYDDSFDDTYAYIEFNIPNKFKDTAKKMFIQEPKSFETRFKRELQEMKIPGTKAYNTANMIAEKMKDALKNDNGNVHIIEL